VRTLRILGTRGIPARHGGFETFAERLAIHLARRGWAVTVYCQEAGSGEIRQDTWEGVRRILVPSGVRPKLDTILFDWKSAQHASREDGLVLTLGYNTGVFGLVHRLKGIPQVINMDGIEWRRAKWSLPVKAWFFANEWAACRIADHLIADNPGIRDHLARHVSASKIAMIPYGADAPSEASLEPLAPFRLSPSGYVTVVARPEPENSLLEIVSAFSARRRDLLLALVGEIQPPTTAYRRRLVDAAGPEVRFLGPIYDQGVLGPLRRHARLHIHGHRVGGTNPSLVEALGAGNAILAHDNVFNRWVCGRAACYFGDAVELAELLDALLGDTGELEMMRSAARARHAEAFTWGRVLEAYETLLLRWA